MSEYYVYKYTLETHLKSICNNNEEYANLYATWELDKKTYTSILKTVSANYPHYSLHDDTHSESIITNIEMLLGEDRIKRLSPTETWMILQCSYLHDFGMALLYEEIESQLGTDDFKIYLNDKRNSTDNDLIEAISYIDNLKDNLNNKEFESCWPLKVRKYITYIIADYFRAKHSYMTKEYLGNLSSKWNIDICHNGLIHGRLINLIGDISFLHTQNFNEIMELPYKANGYKSDYIHPRFIAEMLRVGDLLDLDNGRFSDYNEKVNGDLPLTSKIHKKKHKSTRHVLITPEAVEIGVDCCDEEVYREARSWILWLEDEIKNLNMNWTQIIPDNLTGYPPKLTKKNILLRGKQDLNNIIDLRFNISQEKAFDLIEGSNIYENEYTFLREFIQNSIDASKIQLWRDLKRGIYDSWIRKDIKDLDPFDIDEKIYENYEIDIIIKYTEEKDLEIIIRDRGTGITLDNLKDMSNVGNSYDGRKELKKEILDMPAWLRPTGGFGIGMQSAFLVTNRFEAYTQSDMGKAMKIVFESRKLDGYIQVIDSDKEITRGTEIHFNLGKKSGFSFRVGGYVDNYLNNGYDPMVNDDLIVYNVLDKLHSDCNRSIFPIEIRTEREAHNIPVSSIINLNKVPFTEEGGYSYIIDDDLKKMKIWIKNTGIYVEIGLAAIYNMKGQIKIAFKGINLSKENDRYEGFNIFFDILGMDAKKTLKLSRDELREEAHEEINKIIEEVIVFYITKLREKIDELGEVGIKDKVFDKFSFFISAKKVLKDFDSENYKFLVNDIDIKVKTFKKINGIFESQDIKFKEIAASFPYLSYINIEDFREFKNYRDEYDYSYIREKINEKAGIIDKELIIIDEEFIKLIRHYYVSDMQYIDVDREIFIFSVGNYKNDNYKVKVNENTERFLIKLLMYKENNSFCNKSWISGQERRCIPAIEKYSDLAVRSIPFGIEILFYSVNNIISPITRKDSININNYSKDTFLKNIIERDDYKNLVKYVLKNHISSKIRNEGDIKSLYEKLIGEYYDIAK